MRTRVVWLAGVFLIGFLGLSPSHAQVGVNELTNGGFEEGPSMPLDTWAAGTWNVYGTHTIAVVSELRGAAVPEAPIEGKYCLHITVPAAGANFWDVGLQHVGHTFKKGKKYTLSVFLKCKSGTLRVNLKAELGEGPRTGYGERQVTMTDKWAEYSTTTPVFAADTTSGTFIFHIAFAAGDFWVDNVRWYEGDYVPPGLPLSGIPTNPGSTVNSAHGEASTSISAGGAVGDPRSTELNRLIDQLKGNNSRSRARAASSLGKLGDKRAVEPLIAALKDNDASVRRSAAEALAELDWQPATDLQQAYYLVASQKWTEAVKLGPPAVEPFLVALKAPTGSRDFAVHQAARQAFAEIGPIAVEPAIAALKDKDAGLHYSAVVALGILRDKRAVEPLIAALKHDDRTVRSESATALREFGDKRAVEPLIAALKDTDDGVRRFAAGALGELGDKRAVEPLIAALKDQNNYVRSYAATALGSLGDERAIEPLIATVNDADRKVRWLADSALVRLADKGSADRLAAHLEDKDPRVRAAVVSTLARMGDRRAFEPLVAALKDKDPEVRGMAASALEKLGDERAFEPLIAALKDENAEVRRMGASALGGLGDKRAFEPLITALKDEDRSVRSSASEALGRLGDPRAVEPLIAALKDKDAGVRGSVAWALAQLGDERAVEPLRGALRDDDGKVLSNVAFALAGLLGDERAVEPLLTATENLGDFEGLVLLGMLMGIGPPAVEPLIAALKQEDKRVRDLAAHVLVELDDKRAVEPLITALKGEYHDILRAEGKALEGISPSTVEQLIALLKRKDTFYVRNSSAWALGWLGDKRAVEPLVAALGDAGVVGNAAWLARVQVAVALGRLGDKRAIEPLIRELKRLAPSEDEERLAQFKNKDVDLFGKLPGLAHIQRRQVVTRLDALVKIGSPAVEPIIGLLKDENAHARSFAAEGLGDLGDKRAVQPLVALLKDEDEEVRQSATKALSKLGRQPGQVLQ